MPFDNRNVEDASRSHGRRANRFGAPGAGSRCASYARKAAIDKQLRRSLMKLVARFPTREEGHTIRPLRCFNGRASSRSRSEAAGANPRHAKGQNLIGAMCRRRNHDCAAAAFTARGNGPSRPPYRNLGYRASARRLGSRRRGLSEAHDRPTSEGGETRHRDVARAAKTMQCREEFSAASPTTVS